jgi:L-threonylcarbamoyladenylate synthase
MVAEMRRQVTTVIRQIDPVMPEPAIIAEAAAIIRAGGLVAFPTETVYGLGANALDGQAVTAIFAAKGRPANDPVIVHIADRPQLAQVAVAPGPLAERLMAVCWPGPLTLILHRAVIVPAVVSAGLPTVAVRLPSHPVALALIRASGLPIAAPSANRFSRPSATLAAHVLADLDERVDLLLDAGPASIGVESTIVDLSGPAPRLLRPGGIAVERLEALIGPLERPTGNLDDAAALLAPGLLSRHYSPRATMRVIVGRRDLARQRLGQLLAEAAVGDQAVGALLVDEDLELVDWLPVQVERLGSERCLRTVAERLFAAMRRLDEAGVAVILTRSLTTDGLGLAILDRLTRAAAGQVILAAEHG